MTTDPILPTPISVHDVNDIEALVWKAIHTTLGRRGNKLDDQRKRQMASELIGTVWELSLRYDKQRSRVGRFDLYAYFVLRYRITDWYRKEFGRPYVSLDDILEYDQHEGEVDNSRRLRLDEAIASSAMDPAESGDADLGRVLHQGSRQRPGPIPTPSQQPPARAA